MGSKIPQEIINNLINQNRVFIKFPISDFIQLQRSQLPYLTPYQSKNAIWNFIKQNLGKDLWKLTVPITFNEPLSMVQRCAELLEYSDLLRQANQIKDPHLKLLYVISSFYLTYANTAFRFNKPFNPLLGETYELIQNDLKFVAEQVSHHPPITSFYCESNDFVVEGDLYISLKISLSSFKVLAKGKFQVTLKSTNETFEVIRPKTYVHNYLLGNAYLWQTGDLVCTNLKTNEKCVITFKSKGWTSKNDYVCNGYLLDSKGIKQYSLYGLWNQYIEATKLSNNLSFELGRKIDHPENFEKQYRFTKFAITLNNINKQMLDNICPTDCRLRPDLRAYENGDYDLGAKEKERLEQKQRKRRKALEGENQIWQPLWFDFKMTNGDFSSQFNNKYWKCKEENKWPGEIVDLYCD